MNIRDYKQDKPGLTLTLYDEGTKDKRLHQKQDKPGLTLTLYDEGTTNEKKQVLMKRGTLAPFFVHELDHASMPASMPAMSISWPRLKVTKPNVPNLTRSSCAKLVEHSRYIDINYGILAQYAKTLNKEEIDNCVCNINAFQLGLEDADLSERAIINMSCFFVLLKFGSGFRSRLQRFSAGHGVDTIRMGVLNMYKRHPKLDVKSLNGITINDVANLFQIDYSESLAHKSLCDMVKECIQETVNILQLKQFNDFADYVYHYMDIAYIKAQTKDLKTVQRKLSGDRKLGLTFAPTKSNIIKRCVVVDFVAFVNVENNEIYRDLIQRGAFLYSVNDLVVYNRPFGEIISRIIDVTKGTAADDCNPVVTLQFGLQLNAQPETIQTLLFAFINDFSALNDQYLYKSLFSPRKHLRVYFFQSVQSIIMELYYNLYVRAGNKRNSLFNFDDISTLTAVVDNVIPFVLLQKNVLCLKDEYKEDWGRYNDASHILLSSDLEAEIISNAIWAIEVLLKESKTDINIAKLTYFLRNEGKSERYPNYSKFPHVCL